MPLLLLDFLAVFRVEAVESWSDEPTVSIYRCLSR